MHHFAAQSLVSLGDPLAIGRLRAVFEQRQSDGDPFTVAAIFPLFSSENRNIAVVRCATTRAGSVSADRRLPVRLRRTCPIKINFGSRHCVEPWI
jgi:hypothetical protein